LTVDLDRGQAERRAFPEELARQFLGGRGVNAWFLTREDADDLLVMSCGLLTGTAAPSSSRLHISARSPLTGLLGSSNVGGYLGAELRSYGVRTLMIRGRAEHPSYLYLDGERAEIRDASYLWGLDTRAATAALQAALHAELGAEARVALIGPAGENQVRYACLLTGARRAAGRTGMGAVMGRKNLKAIAVCGARTRFEASEEARQAVRVYARRVRDAPRYEAWSRYSNSNLVTWANEKGLLATRNYQDVRFEGADRIDGTRLIDYVTRARTCHRCPVHCKAEIEIREGRYAGTRGERPEIEPIIALGSKCGVDDPEAVLYLYNLAATLGLDVISLGGVLSFGMELTQRGILSTEDTDRLALEWGNAEAMAQMAERIARREGFGAVLAEGVRRAAEIIGRGAAAYAYHGKGLELTGYDPRGGMGTALGYAVSTRGGDFASVYAVPEYRWGPEEGRAWFGSPAAVDRLDIAAKGAMVKRSMLVSAAVDALGLCKVPVLSVVGDFSLENEAELCSVLTGRELSAGDLLHVGERTVNLERLYNLRHGASRADDDLPDRFVEERVASPGPTQGMTVDIRPMVADFYAAMGWDEEGRPTAETLARLGIDVQE
jgi:aldehyde:ferredoxin oxidoreductase